MYYTYIILCKNATMYIGQTSNLVSRLKQHIDGCYESIGARWTTIHGVGKILCYWTSDTRQDAIMLERKLKKLAQRKRIEIMGNIELLKTYFLYSNEHIYVFHWGEDILELSDDEWVKKYV